MGEIQEIIDKSSPIPNASPVPTFISKAVSSCREYASEESGPFREAGLGMLLAAIFDLAVTAAYIQEVGSDGWLFCRHDREGNVAPMLLYPFVNACPRCSLVNKFYFSESRKPRSAVIGRVSSFIVCCLLNEIVQKNSKGKAAVHLIGGNDVVDAIIKQGDDICLVEIKASPLVTFPLAVETDALPESVIEGIRRTSDHMSVKATGLSKTDIGIFFSLESPPINIGRRKEDEAWPFSELSDYVSQKNNFAQYFTAWKGAYDRYRGQLPKNSYYWLTNGCGQPVPRPANWPARRFGRGFESISDSKSSVGMDRTDDVKKGIYQVLKIGTHYKEFVEKDRYNIRTALVSNMHAVRHYDNYLKEFSDLVWTIDSNERPYKIVKDTKEWRVPAEGIHSLYDALFGFTAAHIRDPWLKSIIEIR